MPQQTDANVQEKNFSLDESKSDNLESTNPSESIPPPNKTAINVPHRSPRKLKRMNATNYIPRYLPDNESATIEPDQPKSSSVHTQKVNKLRRRNAKYNIPKIELDDDDKKTPENTNNEKENQTNPGFDNEEAFNEDESDPFDDDEETNSEGANSQTETHQDESEEIKTEKNEQSQPEKAETTIPIQSETQPQPTETTSPIQTPTETSLPIQTETQPQPTETISPIQTPTETSLPTQTEKPPQPTETPLSIQEPTETSLPIQTEKPPQPTETPISIQEPTETSLPIQTEKPPTGTSLPIQTKEEKNEDFSENKNVKKKLPKFHIVSVSPQTVSTHGDEKIEILMNATLDGPPFIRFGENKIVHGRHSKKDLTVKCRTPRLQEGEIEISVSIDKVKWCEPFPLIVIADEADLPWIFVCCAGIAIIAVSLMVSKLVCGKRAVPKKKKSSKYHDDDLMNIMAPNYSSNDLRKRTKITTEV